MLPVVTMLTPHGARSVCGGARGKRATPAHGAVPYTHPGVKLTAIMRVSRVIRLSTDAIAYRPVCDISRYGSQSTIKV